MSGRICSHNTLKVGMSVSGILSATGTLGSFTIPHSIASINEKSVTVQGNNVPSAYPDPRKKNGVADRSITNESPITRLTASNPDIHTLAASALLRASDLSSLVIVSSSDSSAGLSR